MKYIIFDLDDTVLPKNKAISKFTIDTFKAYQEHGDLIIINTARGRDSTVQYIKDVNADYAICNGGNLILDTNGNPIYSNSMNLTNVNGLISELHSIIIDDTISIETNDGMYSTHPEQIQTCTAKYFDSHKPIKDLDVYKVVIGSYEYGKADEISKKYGFNYINYLNGMFGRISLDGITKWSGVEELLKITNGNREDTICFGDDTGDIEMLEHAGVGVAMGNSKEAVLDKIPITTFNCEDDGVARYLLEHYPIIK